MDVASGQSLIVPEWLSTYLIMVMILVVLIIAFLIWRQWRLSRQRRTRRALDLSPAAQAFKDQLRRIDLDLDKPLRSDDALSKMDLGNSLTHDEKPSEKPSKYDDEQ